LSLLKKIKKLIYKKNHKMNFFFYWSNFGSQTNLKLLEVGCSILNIEFFEWSGIGQ